MSRASDHFEELRRAAYNRGRSDYLRFAACRVEEGQEVWKNNPYQNNHATDEREEWDRGFEDERRESQRGNRS